MKIIACRGVQHLKTRSGKIKFFRSKRTAYNYLKRVGLYDELGKKVTLHTYF